MNKVRSLSKSSVNAALTYLDTTTLTSIGAFRLMKHSHIEYAIHAPPQQEIVNVHKRYVSRDPDSGVLLYGPWTRAWGICGIEKNHHEIYRVVERHHGMEAASWEKHSWRIIHCLHHARDSKSHQKLPAMFAILLDQTYPDLIKNQNDFRNNAVRLFINFENKTRGSK